MTRQEALAIAKPILFNTPMVQAILDNRKTVTRRVIKRKYSNTHFMFRTDKYGTEFVEMQNDVEGETFGKNADGSRWNKLRGYIRPKLPYKVGDILYVRETWARVDNEIVYRADDEIPEGWHLTAWHPSIHMTKEAARIFLRVTSINVERLQDITEEQAKAEGVITNNAVKVSSYRYWFEELWSSTIPKADLDTYGWNANPWVWVIEFERIEVV